MLCCVYTVINKLGLAKPEARPTPAQTVRCLSNSLYYFSNFIVMIWKVHSSCDPSDSSVAVVTAHCCCCWPSLTGLCCCCCDSAAAAEAGARGWPRPSHHLVCGRRQGERHRQLHWYTPRARRGLTIPASHWSHSACCCPLIGQMLSVGLSLGLGCPRALLENSDQGPQMILYQMYFSFSICPVLFHVTVINFTRFPLK